MQAEDHSRTRRSGGLIIGELLVAVLVLAVAVSSLAALMYSVSHRTESRAESACTDRSGIAGSNCAAPANPGGGPRLLRSGCVARSGNRVRGCSDSLAAREASSETILKSRTDSVSLSLVAKRQKSPPPSARPERGFIR